MTIAAARSGKDVHVRSPGGQPRRGLGLPRNDQTLRSRVPVRYRSAVDGRMSPRMRAGPQRTDRGDSRDPRDRPQQHPRRHAAGETRAAGIGLRPLGRPGAVAAVLRLSGQRPGWYHVYHYALGFIAGWGAHPLDLLLWAYDLHETGPWEVEGTGIIPTEGCNDAVIDWNCRIRLGNGVPMTYRAHGLGPDRDPGLTKLGNYTQLIGTEGWVALYYGGFLCQPDSLRQVHLGPNDIHLPVSPNHERNFIDCVKRRGPQSAMSMTRYVPTPSATSAISPSARAASCLGPGQGRVRERPCGQPSLCACRPRGVGQVSVAEARLFGRAGLLFRDMKTEDYNGQRLTRRHQLRRASPEP